MSERERLADKYCADYGHYSQMDGPGYVIRKNAFLAGYDAGLEAAAKRCDLEIVVDGPPWATGVIDICRTMAIWIRAMKGKE